MDINKKLDRYIKQNLKPERTSFKNLFYAQEIDTCDMDYSINLKRKSINNYIDENYEKETFQTKLFKYIDEKNLKDSDVYNKVNIDRRLFSKIRSDINYHPSKETIILLGIALKLSEDEIEDLLESASYSLPKNNKFDLIIRFCFINKIYDLIKINEFLYDRGCKTLKTE